MKLLIISEYYIDTTNANADCVRKITEELCSSGNKVDVVCDSLSQSDGYELYKNNLHVYPVQLKNNKRITKNYGKSNFGYYRKRLLSILFKSLLIPMFPLQDIKRANALYDMALALSKDNLYDAVIVTHKSIESVYAGVWLKKKTGIHTVMYELDPLINEIDAHLGLSRVLQPLAQIKEVALYKNFDLIIHMVCHRPRFEKKKYSTLMNKQIFLDFPLYESLPKGEIKISIHRDELKFLCVGTLDSTYRSPFGMIDILKAYRCEKKMRIDFYTKGDCEKELKEIEKQENAFIHVHGYVSPDELKKRINDSDILIDIGNKYSSMVPSKIFHMFTYGKPIIHFSLQKEDASVPYLSRYPFALIIPYDISLEECVSKIRCFIQKIISSDDVILSDDLNKLFYSNTPQYNSNKIMESLYEI